MGLNMDQYLMEQPYFTLLNCFYFLMAALLFLYILWIEYYTTILEWVRFKYPSETNKDPGFLPKQILPCHFLQIQKRIEV